MTSVCAGGAGRSRRPGSRFAGAGVPRSGRLPGRAGSAGTAGPAPARDVPGLRRDVRRDRDALDPAARVGAADQQPPAQPAGVRLGSSSPITPITMSTQPAVCRLKTEVLAVTAKARIAPIADERQA